MDAKYKKYEQTANDILNEISNYYSLPKVQIRWSNLANLLNDKYNVIIVPYTLFEGKISQIFAGSLYADSTGTIIGYNATSQQKPSRQHFTIVHEGVHYFCDVNNTSSQSFSDLLQKQAYSAEEQKQEDNANFVASLIMCNDECLLQCLSKGYSFVELMGEFGMSSNAMWTRIYNYLHYNLEIPHTRSKTLTSAFENGNSLDRRTFLNVFIKHKQRFLRYFRDIYIFSSNDVRKMFSNIHIPFNGSYFYQLQNLIDDLFTEKGKICPNCNQTFLNKHYCSFCGTELNDYDFIKKGESKMKEIATSDDGIAKVCPNCGIENIHNDLLCPYCGAYERNICTGITITNYAKYILNYPNVDKEGSSWIINFNPENLKRLNGSIPGNLIFENVISANEFTYSEYRHEELHQVPGYARFCPDCGCITSYCLQGFLKPISSNNKSKDRANAE